MAAAAQRQRVSPRPIGRVGMASIMSRALSNRSCWAGPNGGPGCNDSVKDSTTIGGCAHGERGCDWGLFCVISLRHQFRVAWRKNLQPTLRRYQFDVRFFVVRNDTEAAFEAAEFGDVVFLNNSVSGRLLVHYQQRSTESIAWGLRQGGWEWFIRADDDTFWCAASLRRELQAQTRLLAAHPRQPCVHLGHYGMQRWFRPYPVSDVHAVFNRCAAQVFVERNGRSLAAHSAKIEQECVQGPPGRAPNCPSRFKYGAPPGRVYMDVADDHPRVRVVNDVRYCYGGGDPMPRASSLRESWGTGHIAFEGLPSRLVPCLCRCFLALHLGGRGLANSTAAQHFAVLAATSV